MIQSWRKLIQGWQTWREALQENRCQIKEKESNRKSLMEKICKTNFTQCNIQCQCNIPCNSFNQVILQWCRWVCKYQCRCREFNRKQWIWDFKTIRVLKLPSSRNKYRFLHKWTICKINIRPSLISKSQHMIPGMENHLILRCLSTLTNIRCSNSSFQDIQVPITLLNNRNKASKCMARWILNCRNCKDNQIQLSHPLSRRIRKNMKMKSRKCTSRIPNLLMKFHRLKTWKNMITELVKRIWKYPIHKIQTKRTTSQAQNRIHLLLERKFRKLDPILKTRIRIHLSGQKETFLTKTKECQFCLKER